MFTAFSDRGRDHFSGAVREKSINPEASPRNRLRKRHLSAQDRENADSTMSRKPIVRRAGDLWTTFDWFPELPCQTAWRP
jgi:hypothetical protein